MRQRGFIQLSMMGYIALGAAAIILGLSVVIKIQTARLDSAKQELAIEKAEFASFVKQVKTAGIAAKAKADAEIKRQEQATKEVKKTYENRIASIRSDYQRLRDSRIAAGGVSALPEAPRSLDAIPTDAIPLAGLCAETTEQLIQLQGWVTEMGR